MMRHFAQKLCLLLCLMILCGCGYPAVEPVTYDFALAMYSVCNQKSDERLADLREQLEVARSTGTLPEHEAEWLFKIVRTAESGDWEASAQQCRKLLEDQATVR